MRGISGGTMFVLRAAFWFSVVALLMPREADGRAQEPSGQRDGAMISSLQSSALENLARVKAELEARHKRAS